MVYYYHVYSSYHGHLKSLRCLSTHSFGCKSEDQLASYVHIVSVCIVCFYCSWYQAVYCITVCGVTTSTAISYALLSSSIGISTRHISWQVSWPCHSRTTVLWWSEGHCYQMYCWWKEGDSLIFPPPWYCWMYSCFVSIRLLHFSVNPCHQVLAR